MTTQQSLTYNESSFGYLFDGQPRSGLLDNQPTQWAITVHESAQNPNNVVLDASWYNDPIRRRSKAIITTWQAISGNIQNGIEIPSIITVEDFTPVGETWNIQYFVIWGINNSIPFSIYTGEFDSVITIAPTVNAEILRFTSLSIS